MADYPKHLFQTPLYKAWAGMKTRCLNPKNSRYSFYKNIKICDKWMSFSGFLEDMGDSYKSGLSLDRINNLGNYEPGNCRWADATIQANNRRSNRFITIEDKTQTLEQWIREFGLKSSTVRQRIYGLKWSVEKALEVANYR